MKTPREILLEQHQTALPKLDAIRAGVVAGLPAPEPFSWRDWARSLRWHLAGLSVAWVVVIALSTDNSSRAGAIIAHDKVPEARQFWAAFRENRRLLLEYTDSAAMTPPPTPGRRSQINRQQVAV